MKHILCIHNWVRVWDNALDYGCVGTIAIQKSLRFIAKPLLRDRKCHLCSTHIEINTTYAEHLRTCLSLPVYSIDSVTEAVNNFDDSVFYILKVVIVFLDISGVLGIFYLLTYSSCIYCTLYPSAGAITTY